MSKKEKIYIVRYYGGGYDGHYDTNVFATHEKSTAEKYVTRFNAILKKWKDYYAQFEHNNHGYTWIKEKHIELHYSRWHSLRMITKCYYIEIELR